MSKEITIEDIHEAYKKFKSYIYYDNFNLHLRGKLADFETEELDKKLEDLCKNLKQFCKGGAIDVFKSMIEGSTYIVFPKSFKSSDGTRNEGDACVLTNKNVSSFNVSKITILYDAPIELYIISTLWTIRAHEYLNISSDSYGYVVPKYPKSRLLFEPYFNKYQEWRDRGISAAKQQIERGNNVLMITLDIKNFFHSVKVDFVSLKKKLPKGNVKILTDIIELICKDHTAKIFGIRDEGKPILPIGLPSSGIIANWILSEFDKDIKNSTSPVYYGRYVDDMFLVITNVEPDSKNVTDWICNRFFHDKKVLKKSTDRDGKKFLSLVSKRCDGLEIQSQKLRLFYFDAHWSLAVLNKFQTTLQENSSAFWFLPNEEDLKNSLDDTYDLQYEDTINKFRSISSCKVNKYGASVFLAKRLKLAILSPGKFDKELTEDIFRFFNGSSIVSMYSMWEKVFTYFSITHNYKAICRLQTQIGKEIKRVRVAKEGLACDYKIEKKVIGKRMREHLKEHMLKCLMLAKVFVRKNIGLKSSQDDIRDGAVKFKRSLMTRHSYLPLPIFALTQKFIEEDMDISDFNISYLQQCDIYSFIEERNWVIPRNIHLHEICSWKIPKLLAETPFTFYKKGEKDNVENSYLSSCIDYFNKFNGFEGKGLNEIIRFKSHKTYSETIGTSKMLRIYSEIIHVETNSAQSTINVGISNVHTSSNDIETAILHTSSLDGKKRMRHIDILNQAEKIRTDILLLPEVFVPFDWLCAYADESRRKQRAMVFGLEHFSLNNICYNLAITLLPFEYCGRKEVLIMPRIKNHYSPQEIITIKGNRKEIPVTDYSVYHLFQWRGIQFSVYNCYELTDILHRSIFRSELDILFAIEYNRDVNYFGNISESISRDLHCYYIQANTSYYGDSRVVEPKKSVSQNPVRVKGGDNDVILSYELDISALRKFQSQIYVLQKDDPEFKVTPPDFQHEKVEKRGLFEP